MTLLLLTSQDLEKVKTNLPIYKLAGTLSSIPWEMVASVHYRENSLNLNSDNPFQFDPPLGKDQIFHLLTAYTDLPEVMVVKYANTGISDFQTGAICCAAFLVQKCLYQLKINHDSFAVQDAFYGYNGRCSGIATDSSYVMNNYDDKHMNMMIIGTLPDTSNPGKRIPIHTVDSRPGAFTVYTQLTKLGW